MRFNEFRTEEEQRADEIAPAIGALAGAAARAAGPAIGRGLGALGKGAGKLGKKLLGPGKPKPGATAPKPKPGANVAKQAKRAAVGGGVAAGAGALKKGLGKAAGIAGAAGLAGAALSALGSGRGGGASNPYNTKDDEVPDLGVQNPNAGPLPTQTGSTVSAPAGKAPEKATAPDVAMAEPDPKAQQAAQRAADLTK